MSDPHKVIKDELWGRLDEVMRPVGSRHELDISATTLGDWLGDRVFAALFEAGCLHPSEPATVPKRVETVAKLEREIGNFLIQEGALSRLDDFAEHILAAIVDMGAFAAPTSPSEPADVDPGDWHMIHTGEYEMAVAVGAGAIAGWCMGKGEDPPRLTPIYHQALRDGLAVAFNYGVEAARAAFSVSVEPVPSTPRVPGSTERPEGISAVRQEWRVSGVADDKVYGKDHHWERIYEERALADEHVDWLSRADPEATAKVHRRVITTFTGEWVEETNDAD